MQYQTCKTKTCFAGMKVVILPTTITRGGSRAAATSKMEHFVIIVNGCKDVEWWYHFTTPSDSFRKRFLKHRHKMHIYKRHKTKERMQNNIFC